MNVDVKLENGEEEKKRQMKHTKEEKRRIQIKHKLKKDEIRNIDYSE